MRLGKGFWGVLIFALLLWALRPVHVRASENVGPDRSELSWDLPSEFGELSMAASMRQIRAYQFDWEEDDRAIQSRRVWACLWEGKIGKPIPVESYIFQYSARKLVLLGELTDLERAEAQTLVIQLDELLAHPKDVLNPARERARLDARAEWIKMQVANRLYAEDAQKSSDCQFYRLRSLRDLDLVSAAKRIYEIYARACCQRSQKPL